LWLLGVESIAISYKLQALFYIFLNVCPYDGKLSFFGTSSCLMNGHDLHNYFSSGAAPSSILVSYWIYGQLYYSEFIDGRYSC